MAYTFNCATKIIQLGDTDTLEMQDLYSRWKDVVKSNVMIAGCSKAFRVIKEPLQGTAFVGPYYFIMNDWQIRPFDVAHELIVNGTLVQDETSSTQSFKLDDLESVVSIVREVAVTVQVIETGVSGLTAEESVALLAIPENQEVINTGVQKSSLLIPHTQDL